MQSKEMLKLALDTSFTMTMALFEDMQDAPLTRPTEGGNHPLWLLGHLTYSDGWLFWEGMRGEPNPLAEWGDVFAPSSQPGDDASAYPAYDLMLNKCKQIHDEKLALLESLSEEDLDRETQVSEQARPFFGTYRKCFLMGAMHWMNHRGQLAVCRRAAGRKPVFM